MSTVCTTLCTHSTGYARADCHTTAANDRRISNKITTRKIIRKSHGDSITVRLSHCHSIEDERSQKSISPN